MSYKDAKTIKEGDAVEFSLLSNGARLHMWFFISSSTSSKADQPIMARCKLHASVFRTNVLHCIGLGFCRKVRAFSALGARAVEQE